MKNGAWIIYCNSVRVTFPQTENISCWKLCMTKLCIYFLKIAMWNYDEYLTGFSWEWNYLYSGRKGSDMASSQTEGVPDCLEQTTALTGACGLHVADLRPWWLSGLCMHFWRLSLGQSSKPREVTSFPLQNSVGKMGEIHPWIHFP